MKVASDFSGVGAFEQALKSLDVNFETVFACDKDKYARLTYAQNNGTPPYFPMDVYDRDVPGYPLDIYMTSPPCQTFSMAGKRNGEDDDRGLLFYNSLEFIRKNKPRFFIFENVKGLLSHDKANPKEKYGRTFNKWVERLGGKSINGSMVIFPHDESVPYHLYYKVLNAVNFDVPQNRERIFLVGIRDDADNTFRFPEGKKTNKRLVDILEKEVDSKYYLSQKMIDGLILSSEKHKEKGAGYINQDTQASKVFSEETLSPTLCAGTKGYSNGYVMIKSATKKGYEAAKRGDSVDLSRPESKTRRGKVSDVVNALTTHPQKGVIVGAIRGRGKNNDKILELRDEILNTLISVQKDNVIVGENYLQFRKDKKSQGYRCYYTDKQLDTVTTGGLKQKIIDEHLTIRRLTPRESFRAMGFPDEFDISCVSDTQAYKQAGNSIAVPVLSAILGNLLKNAKKKNKTKK